MTTKKDDFKYEIVNELGVISERSKGWRKEFNRVSWNSGEPKYDVRDWDGEHKKMGKGVTLTEAEMRKLYELLGAEIKALDTYVI
ncbi:MAG: hypothetical protein LBO03_09580 [Acidaminococcales bacterium]|jgi:hypothetical protein|nr:hypothetical protein [Acidaminococcales bacterium]